VTKQYKGKLQSVIEDLDLPNPVIRTHYGHGFAKQYVRDDRLLRTEPATNNVYDYGVNKDVENLPHLRERMAAILDNYHNVQQDVMETFIDRGRTAETRRAHDSCQRQADARAQTGPSQATGGDAFAGALRPYRRQRKIHYR
jgi:hypothetical protein